MYLGEEYPMHFIFQENRRNITVEFKNEASDYIEINKYKQIKGDKDEKN